MISQDSEDSLISASNSASALHSSLALFVWSSDSSLACGLEVQASCSAAPGMQGQLQTACIDCTRFSTGDGIGHVLALLCGTPYLIIYSQALVRGPVAGR